MTRYANGGRTFGIGISPIDILLPGASLLIPGGSGITQSENPVEKVTDKVTSAIMDPINQFIAAGAQFVPWIIGGGIVLILVVVGGVVIGTLSQSGAFESLRFPRPRRRHKRRRR